MLLTIEVKVVIKHLTEINHRKSPIEHCPIEHPQKPPEIKQNEKQVTFSLRRFSLSGHSRAKRKQNPKKAGTRKSRLLRMYTQYICADTFIDEAPLLTAAHASATDILGGGRPGKRAHIYMSTHNWRRRRNGSVTCIQAPQSASSTSPRARGDLSAGDAKGKGTLPN